MSSTQKRRTLRKNINVFNKANSPDIVSTSEVEHEDIEEIEIEKDIEFVETEQEEEFDDGILQNDWESVTKEPEEVQDIPIDHGFHAETRDSQFIVFGQQFESGKIIGIHELLSIKDRILSTGQKFEKIPMWLDVSPITDTSAHILEEIFELHPLTIDDWFTLDIREKVALFDNYFAISAIEMRYIEDTNILKTYSLNFVIKKNVILTIHSEQIHAINEVRVQIRDKYKGLFPSAHWVLYAILELIISNYTLLYNHLNNDVHNIEQLTHVLLHDDQDEFLSRIGDLKKRSNTLLFLLSPKKSFLRFILKSKSKLVSKHLKIYLRDILDDTVRLIEKINSLIHNIDNHQETYLAKISLSVNRYSEEENLLMKKFGAIATLFLPMSFIAGLFGMNVTVPGQNNPNLSWFILIISLCIIWMVGGMIFFRMNKWF